VLENFVYAFVENDYYFDFMHCYYVYNIDFIKYALLMQKFSL